MGVAQFLAIGTRVSKFDLEHSAGATEGISAKLGHLCFLDVSCVAHTHHGPSSSPSPGVSQAVLVLIPFSSLNAMKHPTIPFGRLFQ